MKLDPPTAADPASLRSNAAHVRRQRLLPSERAIAEAMGARMRAARIVRGLSRKQLARLVGRSDTMVMYWEQGATSPVTTTLCTVAAALGVTEAGLLGRVSEAEWSEMLDRMTPEQPLLTARLAERKALGANILATRQAKRLTQAGLAQRIGVTAPVISQWEHGSRQPSAKTIRKLARALDVTVAALTGAMPEPAAAPSAATAPPPERVPVGADLPDNLSARLRWLRQRRALSRTALGKAVGVSGATLSRWEEGSTKPSIDQLLLIAAYYGVHPALILTGDRIA